MAHRMFSYSSPRRRLPLAEARLLAWRDQQNSITLLEEPELRLDYLLAVHKNIHEWMTYWSRFEPDPRLRALARKIARECEADMWRWVR